MTADEADRLIELHAALKEAQRRFGESLAEKVTPLQLARDVDAAEDALVLHCKKCGLVKG